MVTHEFRFYQSCGFLKRHSGGILSRLTPAVQKDKAVELKLARLSTMFVLCSLLLAALLPTPAFGVLDRTKDECNKIYGRPSGATTREIRAPARIEYTYSWNGFYIEALFVGRDVIDSLCGHVQYRSASILQSLGPIQELTKLEIEKLLALNANGNRWEPVHGGWKRSDNRALAVELRSTTNNLPSNILIVFGADFYPKDSKEFVELRATLRGHAAK